MYSHLETEVFSPGEQLRRARQRYAEARKINSPLAETMVAIGLIGGMFWFVKHALPLLYWQIMPFAFLAAFVFSSLKIHAVGQTLQFYRNRYERALATCQGKEAEVPLAELIACLRVCPPEILTTLLKVLLPRLTRLSESEAVGLNPSERTLLAGLLRENFLSTPEEVACTLALLRVLTLAGDINAIARIKRLADRSPHPEVRSAAQHTLEVLRALAEQTRQGTTLLRASTTPPPPDTLLRPVTSAETAPEQLLRASHSRD